MNQRIRRGPEKNFQFFSHPFITHRRCQFTYIYSKNVIVLRPYFTANYSAILKVVIFQVSFRISLCLLFCLIWSVECSLKKEGDCGHKLRIRRLEGQWISALIDSQISHSFLKFEFVKIFKIFD